MNALRTVQQVHDGQIHLHLPKQFWGQQVEIIVLSAPQQEELQEAATSLRGCLRQYADPSLASQEDAAWPAVAEEKHGLD